jgi:large subunit ribosomal protein L9
MEVILLERIGRLGQMGDVVRVKDGYARNFLLPKGKALRATSDNKARFESMRSELETKNTAAKGEAGAVASKLEGKVLVALRQASETGQLFGSVSPRDIADMIEADGVKIGRSQVVLNAPIKMIGSYKVPIALHPEVEIAITVNVARSADEAERLARGEDITVRRDQSEAEARAEAAKKAAEAMFDPDAKRGEEESGSEETGTAEAEAEAKPAKPKKAKAAKAEAKAEAKAKEEE